MSNTAIIEKLYERFAKGDLTTCAPEVFAPDIRWSLPGHHPLAGMKQGMAEVTAYFEELRLLGVQLEPVRIENLTDDMVGDIHREHAEHNGANMDVVNITHYKMRDGRISEVQVFLNNQYGADNFFAEVCALKGIPGRFI